MIVVIFRNIANADADDTLADVWTGSNLAADRDVRHGGIRTWLQHQLRILAEAIASCSGQETRFGIVQESDEDADTTDEDVTSFMGTVTRYVPGTFNLRPGLTAYGPPRRFDDGGPFPILRTAERGGLVPDGSGRYG